MVLCEVPGVRHGDHSDPAQSTPLDRDPAHHNGFIEGEAERLRKPARRREEAAASGSTAALPRPDRPNHSFPLLLLSLLRSVGAPPPAVQHEGLGGKSWVVSPT